MLIPNLNLLALRQPFCYHDIPQRLTMGKRTRGPVKILKALLEISYQTAMPRLLGRGTTYHENKQFGLGTYFRVKPSCHPFLWRDTTNYENRTGRV
jgi:hypothetical protein